MDRIAQKALAWFQKVIEIREEIRTFANFPKPFHGIGHSR